MYGTKCFKGVVIVLDEISGVVEHVVFQNDDTGYAVIDVLCNDETVIAVGALSRVTEGEQITAQGSFVTHPTFGVQFKVETCEYRLPATNTAILKYLASGVLAGIGPVTAKRIVDKFGVESFNIISNEPERLGEVKGLNPAKIEKIHEGFKRIYGIREAVKFLAEFDISAANAIDVYRHFGELTIQLVNHNPYILCGFPVFLPFTQMDKMAYGLNLEKDCDKRISAGVIYVLRYNLNNGHSCLPTEKLLPTIASFLDVELEKIQDTMLSLEEKGEIFKYQSNTIEYCFLPHYYKAEMYTAIRIKELVKFPVRNNIDCEKWIKELELVSSIKYAPLQKKAIELALSSNALVLTGGPGTGKTTTINAIIALYEQCYANVVLAAPTGRAAKRLSELTGKDAKTIHRLLQVAFATAGEEMRFVHNESNLLKCDVVIIDEMSMVDALLFESLLLALKPNCRIVLVGDTDQLPSVGAGNVLKDIIDSNIMPVVCLEEIFRQAAQSLIISNAHRIIKNESLLKGKLTDDFFMIESHPQDAQKLILDLVCDRLPSKYGFSKVNDIQVLCPSKIGITGTVILNPLLQERVNPPSKEKTELEWMGQKYRLGDKVMQIKNNYDIPYTRTTGEDGSGAFNGDIGVIQKINKHSTEIYVNFDDREYIYTAEFIKQLELAYAVTIHKSQGSEFPAVIIPVCDVPEKLCYRNLFYTGVTRAKQLLVTVGQSRTVEKMAKNDRKNLRYSCLSSLINDENLL